MFRKLSDRNSFGYMNKHKSASSADIKPTFGIDKNTLLMLHMEGDEDGAVFTDSSLYARNVSATNVTTNASAKKFGETGALFSSGSLVIPGSSDFYLDGDWTIDFWVNSSLPTSGCFFGRSGDNGLGGGDLYLYWNSGFRLGGFGDTEYYLGSIISPNVMQHVALVMHDGTLMAAGNGVFSFSQETYPSHSDSGDFKIGHNYNINYFAGGIDEFRISNIARWTEDFTVPAKAYS